MKKKFLSCVILLAMFFAFSINVKAITVEEVTKVINNYYNEIYENTEFKDIISYSAKFDSNENKINFELKYNCTGNCDGKVLFGRAEDYNVNFYWNYNEDEKSIEYKNDGTVNDKNLNEVIHVFLQVEQIFDKAGYDVSFLENITSDYNENNFECESVDIPKDYKSSDGSAYNGKMVKKFKIYIDELSISNVEKKDNVLDTDIKEKTSDNEISNDAFKNSIMNIENPKTSDINGYLIILPIAFFITLIFIGIKKIRKL